MRQLAGSELAVAGSELDQSCMRQLAGSELHHVILRAVQIFTHLLLQGYSTQAHTD